MRLPLTLRLIFHGLRGVMLALTITLLGWVTLVPATAAERAALNAPLGATSPDGLLELRIARAMIHFAPERSAQMLSRASNGEISPELAEMILRDIAFGTQDVPSSATPPERQTGGARFVTVD
ncbi:hypothetical protein [Yoonia vestfoldensis]|uniref:hypothetical protein n=1 Tax=Yoonia vestfoldensis TaxID=245188 RepID=UPI00037CB265|nr:hypothetical protein [Yoonia vestfoldensis]